MQDLSNENVIHQKSGEIEYLQFKKLLQYKYCRLLLSSGK